MSKISYTKVSDKIAYANSVELDQTAPSGAVWSGSTLFAISLSLLRNSFTKVKKFGQKKDGIKCSKILDIYPIYLMNSDRQVWAKGVDLCQMPQNATADQGVHHLPLVQQFLDTSTSNRKVLFWFKDKYGKE